jgi:hypothetical protein
MRHSNWTPKSNPNNALISNLENSGRLNDPAYHPQGVLRGPLGPRNVKFLARSEGFDATETNPCCKLIFILLT